MRKAVLLLLVLTIVFSCAACGAGVEAPVASNKVILEEGEGYTVENNGQTIPAGENATFLLNVDRGTEVVGCNYSGHYDISLENGKTVLTLYFVSYPTRVTLELSSRSCKLAYDPNGGHSLDGSTETVTKVSSLQYHARPNTSIGIDLFLREGYTLLCWNTRADGNGERIGLGSRVTHRSGTLTLYAQWVKWTPEECFLYEIVDGTAAITGYRGTEEQLVIPAELGGCPVKTIREGAFTGCSAKSVILPVSLQTLEDGSFASSAITELTLSDNLAEFSDAAFSDCIFLKTLHINAVEAPFGYLYRKESCYADKVDLLILAKGQKKMVFYGGCSVWYNLDGAMMDKAFGSDYRIINMGLNGTCSSAVQLQIMGPYMEEGDILFHTPELSSVVQTMEYTDMRDGDSPLWCGIENNYDLFTAVDLRSINGVFDSFCYYLSIKNERTDYQKYYYKEGEYDLPYLDSYGCIPFYRSKTAEQLLDSVTLKPKEDEQAFYNLTAYYQKYQAMGVTVYVSCACTNLDALPEEEAENLPLIEAMFRDSVELLTGSTPISVFSDYLYHSSDCYDTNYHLLTEAAKKNTALWIRDLTARMAEDGLWEETP